MLGQRLHDTLGITTPVLQSGMGGVAGPELAAAVSNAGGLGILAALRRKPDDLEAMIVQLRTLTDRPFGVNIWLHDDVRQPPDPGSLDEDLVRGAQSVLNESRARFDLPATLDRPRTEPDLVNAALEVMIEARVPVFSAAIGVPEPELVERFHRAGSKVVAMVASVEDAIAAVANGADVLVAQGSEAGGHRSYGQKRPFGDATGSSVMTLVPQIIAATNGAVPIAAAGGVVDGRGLAAMLALGADGALLGTRFVATFESEASQVWKDRLTESGLAETALTDGFTGQWARVLRSEFTDSWAESGAEALPGLLQGGAGADLFAEAKRLDDDQYQPLYAGSGVGQIHDLPSAAEVVRGLEHEARQTLNALAG